MGTFGSLFALRIAMLAAATAQSLGFIGVVAGWLSYDLLQAWKWPLLIGGTIAIGVLQWLTAVVARRAAGAADRPDRQG